MVANHYLLVSGVQLDSSRLCYTQQDDFSAASASCRTAGLLAVETIPSFWKSFDTDWTLSDVDFIQYYILGLYERMDSQF